MYIDTDNKQWNIVAITPCGRRDTLEILARYIFRDIDKGLIDEWQLWENTKKQDDINCIHELAQHSKVSIRTIPDGDGSCWMIHRFYTNCIDENTIYLRFDDDIVWIGENSVEELIKTRLENPEPFLVFSNIINNTRASYYHQQKGIYEPHWELTDNCLNPTAWQDFEFVKMIHDTFKRRYSLELYDIENITLPDTRHFSINSFAVFGKDLATFGGVFGTADEERLLSEFKPTELNRPCMISGKAQVVHFSYYPQRPHLDTCPEYLNYYKERSNNL